MRPTSRWPRLRALRPPPRPDVALHVECLRADAVTVDVLARLQLAARQRGGQIRLCGASQELLDLIAFMGLEDVLRD